jgi:hypothetical protein
MMHYNTKGTPLLVVFTDSNWVDKHDDRNSTTSYDFSLGLGPATWDCKKQHATSLSLAKLEY